eukprot:CAMPEP_0206372350 /NCGR_PEP_ID=MMETSP0294-20121207/7057_1 /ASSEMBLY_ACC=CAM_ASM_000327 /TAXON_ID=39354 /ORGANISM="Heterosigma akashiwo, Strain CCMP2393" /LENGTH=58 /DNA_ID=CAMNT_0053819713 /DNA_START=611 /DNA_END=787 /DNA_ORIENTATION=-
MTPYFEMKVITDGTTEQLIDLLLAKNDVPLQLPTFQDDEVMTSSQSHQVGQTLLYPTW